MRLFLPAALSFGLLHALACDFTIIEGNGEALKKHHEIDASAHAVEAHSQLSVVIGFGEEPRVFVSGDSNLVEHIAVQVKEGVVILDDDLSDTVIMDPTLDLVAEVTLSSLDRVSLEGTGDLNVKDAWQTEAAELVFSGTGDIKIPDLTATATTLRADGTGRIAVAGSTDTLDLDASGTGDLDLGDFVARAVTVSADGTGSVTVHATESISGSASGTGAITVRGDPPSRDLDAAGTGAVNFE
jgi:hypothetical protein